MDFSQMHSCHLGPEISSEIFINEHFFLYILEGYMLAYDGLSRYMLGPGDYCIARKNHLIRYTKKQEHGIFRKIVITLDEKFLKKFLGNEVPVVAEGSSNDALLIGPESRSVSNFIKSIIPPEEYPDTSKTDLIDQKRAEALRIILKVIPESYQVLFNFGAPQKINLEEFMNRNFRFNADLGKLAFLTGRSLSSFKRDFRKIFGTTPRAWLTQKRLKEAHFLLQVENKKPGEIYLDLGFEDYSHFSFAFRKYFGYAPSMLVKHLSKL